MIMKEKREQENDENPSDVGCLTAVGSPSNVDCLGKAWLALSF